MNGQIYVDAFSSSSDNFVMVSSIIKGLCLTISFDGDSFFYILSKNWKSSIPEVGTMTPWRRRLITQL